MEVGIDTPSSGHSTGLTQREGSPAQNQANNRRIGEPERTGNQDRSKRNHRRPRRNNQPPLNDGAPTAPVSSEGTTTPLQNPKRRNPKPPNTNQINKTSGEDNAGKVLHPRDATTGPGRRARFKAELTDPNLASASVTKPSDRYKWRNKAKSEAVPDDLTSTLIHALRTPPYPDCPICFSSIHPAQPTWSCSPSIPIIRATDSQTDEQQYCWTTFHVKCIGSWATKSVKDVADAWRTRGEDGHRGDWRCPGCQAKRETVPSGYWCFCNSTPEPKPPRLSTPHSCGNPCSRARESGCGHPCPLACHPGPCPPCQVTTRLECYCPRKNVLSFRCGLDQGRGMHRKGRDLSCGNICGRKLGCGKHSCEQVCHDGPCQGCSVRELARCWCGKEEKEVGCGEGEEVRCSPEGDEHWIGRFKCNSVCERLFDCGVHKCQKACHPPSFRPAPCPYSPSKVTSCPCGSHPIASPLVHVPKTNPSTFPARAHCTSPIPTCTSTCGKARPNCDHSCTAQCHTGPCPPCTVAITRPCRCGATTKSIRCFELNAQSNSGEILCDKPCMALRACGRHQCRRLCCPLASLSSAKKKGKKRAEDVDSGMAIGEEQGGLHECDLVCGKPLGCGNHTCEERDHKGACPPCLRSSFEEMICYCGRTILEPPIPCGTQIRCNYQCPRPAPPCGHPRTQHFCHEEPSQCPPCPFLATKMCACGKKSVANVRCSLEKVSCGSVCGKLMKCGFHHCERLCHGDDCGACTASCGKSRKLCLPNHHACTHACHAPSACPEDDPCQSLVVLSCPCGRVHQSVLCGRSTSNQSGQSRHTIPPKCTNECNIAKRNARLADALGITPESREKTTAVSYPDGLVALARVNIKFMGVVEKAFADFVTSGKKTQLLPHMPAERRKFVHDLAGIYRMDTQMVDQEPHRSVRLLRRVDTRIPTPLLSSIVTPSVLAQPNLGKLADLRAASITPPNAPTPSSSIQRGWTSVVTRPTPVATPIPSTSSDPRKVATSTNVSRVPTPSIPEQPRVLATGPNQPIGTGNEVVPDSWEDDL